MFFRNLSKDSQYFFLNVSRPLRKVFKTSFVKISKFLKNLKIFKKFRTIFFSEIFRYFEVCSRDDLVVFLGLCSSGDLERISEIGHFKAKKTCFLEIYHNILDLFFWMFRVCSPRFASLRRTRRPRQLVEKNNLSPGGGPLKGSPMGSHLSLFSFYIL